MQARTCITCNVDPNSAVECCADSNAISCVTPKGIVSTVIQTTSDMIKGAIDAIADAIFPQAKGFIDPLISVPTKLVSNLTETLPLIGGSKQVANVPVSKVIEAVSASPNINGACQAISKNLSGSMERNPWYSQQQAALHSSRSARRRY